MDKDKRHVSPVIEKLCISLPRLSLDNCPTMQIDDSTQPYKRIRTHSRIEYVELQDIPIQSVSCIKECTNL